MPDLRQMVRRRLSEARLRHRLRRQLTTAGITGPMSMWEVCRLLGQQRGKPIQLLEFPFWVPGPFGLWLNTSSADYILYQQQTTRAHQEHIVGHELGHLVLDHPSDETDDSVWSELMPNVDPEHIRRALRRTEYHTKREHNAETAATLLLQTASVSAAVTRPSYSARARRAQEALDRDGWL